MPDTPAQTLQIPDQEMNALIAKHQQEIDRIKIMDPAEQMQAFRDYGFDPAAVMNHYKNLSERAQELQREDKSATNKTTVTGIASLAAAAIAAFVFRKKISPSKVVQGFAVPVSGFTAGFFGTFFGSRIFAGKIRDESHQLASDASAALERELAVAIENKERGGLKPTPVPASAMTANIPKRDASFTAQAAAEKNAAANLPDRRV